MSQLYMVVRVTTKETAVILNVANIEVATLLGQLYLAEHPGQKVIAPPLEGRGFAKMERELLQYVFWNTFNITPPDDYAELIQAALENAKKIALTEAQPSTLRASLETYNVSNTFDEKGQVVSQTASERKSSGKEKVPRAPRPLKADGTVDMDRPRENSTSGMIWAVADKHFQNIKDLKELRKAVVEECTNEGINSSTTSVQFGKWKAYNNI